MINTSPHSVKNVNAFLSKIEDIQIEPDEIMISFDVVSLFTSIPLDTARQITKNLLTNNTSWQTKTQLNTQDMLDLLDSCLSTEFCFQNNYYQQISHTPMGSPLSRFLAEVVMQDLESKAVTNNNDIKTWDRYVDDVFATVKKDKTEDVLQTINNTTKNIKFTNEEEHDKQTCIFGRTYNKDGQWHLEHRSISQENTYRPNIKLQQQSPNTTQNQLYFNTTDFVLCWVIAVVV